MVTTFDEGENPTKLAKSGISFSALLGSAERTLRNEDTKTMHINWAWSQDLTCCIFKI